LLFYDKGLRKHASGNAPRMNSCPWMQNAAQGEPGGIRFLRAAWQRCVGRAAYSQPRAFI
jgi:hypothetical protein